MSTSSNSTSCRFCASSKNHLATDSPTRPGLVLPIMMPILSIEDSLHRLAPDQSQSSAVPAGKLALCDSVPKNAIVSSATKSNSCEHAHDEEGEQSDDLGDRKHGLRLGWCQCLQYGHFQEKLND